MNFRDREKRRLIPLKSNLFTAPACEPGTYNGKRREFCLHDDYSHENLFLDIRREALVYFRARGIQWHDGLTYKQKKDLPSNHLCCSQSCCVNFWFPFICRPDCLGAVLSGLGFSVEEVLPFERDTPLEDGSHPYVSFEWIGERNYLREGPGGIPLPDNQRIRGKNSTSADFAMRFREKNGKVRIILGEWKYTENYPRRKSIRFSPSGTDRLNNVY